MNKKEIEAKKELALILYMSGDTQNAISERINVSAVTISKWVKSGGWDARRAAKVVSRTEIVNKLLLAIDKLIEQVSTSENPDDINGLGDKLAKISATIERLDKKSNVVTEIETFTAFGNWMLLRMELDPDLTPELVKKINHYQDVFINERLTQR
jgi:uncharacterized protein YjcR